MKNKVLLGMVVLFVFSGLVGLLHSAAGENRGIGGTGLAHGSASPQKWAIIIGVGDYEDPGISDLPNAVNDAQALEQTLLSLAEGFPRENVTVLTDTQESARLPRRSNLIRFLTGRLRLAGIEDTVLVYFAGHGTTAGDALYLLPSDAALVDVSQTGPAFAEVERLLDECRARKKVLILDACHSATGRGDDVQTRVAIAELERASQGKVVLASCGERERSHEMPKTGHGAFTFFLLEGLKGKADSNGDGHITATELSLYTWDATRRWASQQGLTQTPWRQGQVAGDIVLAKAHAGGFLGPTPPTPNGPMRPQDDSGTAETDTKRFEKLQGGVILDRRTGLQWLVGPEKVKYGKAEEWVTNSNVDGGAWRMPSHAEVLSLYDPKAGPRNRDPLFASNSVIWTGDVHRQRTTFVSSDRRVVFVFYTERFYPTLQLKAGTAYGMLRSEKFGVYAVRSN